MTAQSHSEPEIIVRKASTNHLVVSYPDLLRVEEYQDVEGVDLVLVAKETDLPFRPNIVFTSVLSAASLMDASMAAIISAAEQHPGARPVSIDVFFGSLALTEDAPIGRVFVFTYPGTTTLDVIVKKWVIATGKHHLHISAAYLPSQALAVEETFDWIAANMQFTSSMEAIHKAATSLSEVGVLRDDEASTRAGFPLEELSVIEPPVPATAKGFPVAGIEILTDAWGVRLDQGKVLHLIITRGTEQGIYVVYPGKDGLLVLRSSGASAFDLNPTQVEAYGLSAEQLPADVAAWMGIVPAFRFGGPWSISSEEYANHRDGAAEGDQWSEFRIEHNAGWLRVVYVPGEGFYEAISPVEGTITLDALPSAGLFDLILRRIDAVLGAKQSP